MTWDPQRLPGGTARSARPDAVQRRRRAQADRSTFRRRGRPADFLQLMLQKPNFLVLDEPTNHLDLESINALNFALQKYPGTLLLVTHDHDLIDEVATRIWHVEKGKVEDFKGTYAQFLSQLPEASFA